MWNDYLIFFNAASKTAFPLFASILLLAYCTLVVPISEIFKRLSSLDERFFHLFFLVGCHGNRFLERESWNKGKEREKGDDEREKCFDQIVKWDYILNKCSANVITFWIRTVLIHSTDSFVGISLLFIF